MVTQLKWSVMQLLALKLLKNEIIVKGLEIVQMLHFLKSLNLLELQKLFRIEKLLNVIKGKTVQNFRARRMG